MEEFFSSLLKVHVCIYVCVSRERNVCNDNWSIKGSIVGRSTEKGKGSIRNEGSQRFSLKGIELKQRSNGKKKGRRRRNVARVRVYYITGVGPFNDRIISIYITKDYPQEERILCTPLHRKKINEVAH